VGIAYFGRDLLHIRNQEVELKWGDRLHADRYSFLLEKDGGWNEVSHQIDSRN